MLRLATVLALVCAFATTARADLQLAVPASMLARDMDPVTRLVLVEHNAREGERGRGLRGAGIALTVIGLAFTVTGVGLFAPMLMSERGGFGSISGGIALMTLGPIASLIGAPMWAVGQQRASRAERANVALSATALRVTF